MAAASITHLKLFLDQTTRQVALFNGPDEAQQWLRNVPAEAVLSAGWHLLPKETLITVEEVESQGFLLPGALAPSDGPDPDNLALAWAMRAAGLAAQQAEQASAAHDAAAEASGCQRVAHFLDQAATHTAERAQLEEIAHKRAAWLVRGVNALLAAWNDSPSPEHAEALAQLFAALAEDRWNLGLPDLEQARQNHRFWSRRAAAAWADASQQAEQTGDLARAESGAAAVVRLLDALRAQAA
ncbi:MAG: hypothetical protein VKM98_06850 [Cyanobacteriota bacterium]|nr:hypothetical protein [Cyanobacteriota bacterium]